MAPLLGVIGFILLMPIPVCACGGASYAFGARFHISPRVGAAALYHAVLTELPFGTSRSAVMAACAEIDREAINPPLCRSSGKEVTLQLRLNGGLVLRRVTGVTVVFRFDDLDRLRELEVQAEHELAAAPPA